jgi:hypothetical protein
MVELTTNQLYLINDRMLQLLQELDLANFDDQEHEDAVLDKLTYEFVDLLDNVGLT